MAANIQNAEIIAVGSELLTPQRLDTNSLYLTGQLNALGVEVVRKTVVGDERERLTDSILGAAARSQIVVLTGGLGPTEDDLTREAIAGALGRQLVFEQAICDQIEARIRAFGRKTMAEINRRQAFVVEGAEVLPNDRGTAPGQWIANDGVVFMLLPGPPMELQPMFEKHCLPRLEKLLPPQVIRTRWLRVVGMGESDLDELISPVYKRYQNLATTILAVSGEIHIHLRARCATAEEAESLVAQASAEIEPLLGDRMYSCNGDSLEKVCGNLLTGLHATVSVAESATSGLLGARITAVPASAYFVGGFLTYTDAMKTQLLGVPAELIAEHTAVSEEVAKAMAEGARERTRSDYALSITGYAGPDGDKVGLVFIGLASPDSTEIRRVQWPADRDRVRAFSTNIALDMLRRKLLAAPR
jgi:nicotinamide-nucleotide amidase